MPATSTGLSPRVLAQFPAVRGHLDAATSGVPPLAAAAAMRAAVDAWGEGRIDGPSYDDAIERSRRAFARLVGVDPREVAQGAQVSVFAGLVAASLPRRARVLTAAGDFTSVLFPMLAQEPRGVQVRKVPLEELVEAIDARTDLVAVSAVQSADGRVLDLDTLAARRPSRGLGVARRHTSLRLVARRCDPVRLRRRRRLQVAVQPARNRIHGRSP